MEQMDKNFFMIASVAEQPEQETDDQANQFTLLEQELEKQKQAMADLEFSLMMGGVL